MQRPWVNPCQFIGHVSFKSVVADELLVTFRSMSRRLVGVGEMGDAAIEVDTGRLHIFLWLAHLSCAALRATLMVAPASGREEEPGQLGRVR